MGFRGLGCGVHCLRLEGVTRVYKGYISGLNAKFPNPELKSLRQGPCRWHLELSQGLRALEIQDCGI